MPETPYSKDDLEMMLKREVKRRRTAEKERDEAKAKIATFQEEIDRVRRKYSSSTAWERISRLEAALKCLKTCHTSTGFHRCDACKRILDAALSGETGDK